MSLCHCGSARPFAECCEPYLAGVRPAPTAEALMRSRYSAFVTANVGYLHDTVAPDQRHDFDHGETETWAKQSEWQGLEVKSADAGGEGDEVGTVEFIARYRYQGKAYAHHELGRFRREDGRWYYVDGHLNPKPATRQAPKVGRNDPCPCGSGKKHKKCCLAKQG